MRKLIAAACAIKASAVVPKVPTCGAPLVVRKRIWKHSNWLRSRRLIVCAAVALVGLATSAAPVLAAHPGVHGRISFSSDQTGSRQIYTMNPDGSDVRQLTAAAGANSVTSDWSPDGSRIAFDSDRTRAVEIFTMRPDGSDVQQITHLGGFSGDPSWSPNGRHLVFEHASFGQCCTNIWRIDPDGGGLHELTTFSMETRAAEPEYSPDGRSIAFQQFPNGAQLSAIFVMRADGTDMRQVTPISMDAGHPEWSPDGSRIIFNNDFTQPVGDIFTIRPNGTGVKQLTHVIPLGQADFRPDYSPNGKKIVFDRLIPGQPLQLLVMNANGSRAHVVNNSNAFAPDWGRQSLDESSLAG
jgi:Tol biopolymer transport system component